MKQTSLWSGKGAGARFSLFGAALALVCLVGYCIYGAVYDYFCEQHSVPAGVDFLPEIDRYEKSVLAGRK